MSEKANIEIPTEKDNRVACTQCKEFPGWVKQCGDADEVYHALECDCKITPFLRSRTLVESMWNTKTYAQSRKEAFADAKKDTPEFISIFVPADVQ